MVLCNFSAYKNSKSVHLNNYIIYNHKTKVKFCAWCAYVIIIKLIIINILVVKNEIESVLLGSRPVYVNSLPIINKNV